MSKRIEEEKINKHTKVSMNAFDLGVIQGKEQAEKEFLDKIKRAKQVMINEFGFEETKRHRGIITDELAEKQEGGE